jgi:orotidine-5'-phosphate decarboxylase
MNMDKRIIVALDFPTAYDAIKIANELDPDLCRVKIGLELFIADGPYLIDYLSDGHFDVFLDLKLHDIPNTIASACRVAGNLNIWMLNVHASGGSRMMVSARKALEEIENRPRIVGVTVLTSFDEAEWHEVSETPIRERAIVEQVIDLAMLADDSGLDGVVCSPQEASMVRRAVGNDFILVTPGVRPEAHESDDQRRTMTPSEAIKAGADYLVIGRPITRSKRPLETLEAINREIENL